jgi:SAM-dependent methyltransferase
VTSTAAVRTDPSPDSSEPAVAPRSDALQRYFGKRYPNRDQWLGAKVFRAGETARRQIVGRSLPELDGLDVLDVGCGDGDFLASIVRGRPRLLRLEDLIPDSVETAHHRLSDCAEHIEVGVVDSANADCEQRFDIVMAIGVTDYQQNWIRFVAQLLRRTKGRLIVDVPRTDDVRNQLRRLWLWLHGLTLQTATQHGVVAGLAPLCSAPLIQVTRHSWVLCLDRSAMPSRNVPTPRGTP